MVRSADPTLPDSDTAFGPFAAQLALARVHPALAPLSTSAAGYNVDVSVASRWYALPISRGFAGYGLARALRMLLDLLSGLSALHGTQTESGEGFVHGELVPALVRVDPQGAARLLSIAPWHWQTREAPLSPQSLGHLAPERLLGDAIDRRADVFSAGVLLWEALAGCRLFERDSAEQIITRLMGGKVTLPELPPEVAWAVPLKAVALRALSVDPAQRFGDCAELSQAIETAASGHIASHADVAAHFARPLRALPPPMRRSSIAPQFRPLHKSSLSAMVAPSAPAPSRASDSPVEAHPTPKPAGRGAWMLTALVSLGVALGVVAFTRRPEAYAPTHAAPALAAPAFAVARERAAPAPPAAPEPAAPALAAPIESGASAPSASPVEPDTQPGVSERADRPAHLRVVPHVGSSRAVPKLAKPVPAARPSPAAKPHGSDAPAEQYGI